MSELVLSALVVATAGGLAGTLVAGLRLLHWLRTRPTREAESEPTSPDGHIDHVGATDGWSPADEVAHVDTDPALITLPMHMAADHAALAGISTALDQFGQHVDDAVGRFLRHQPAILLRLPRALEDTGPIDIAALWALLDADDQEAVAP